ncbi:unnamed protein product [Acanthoscelides obtectus]|uniref:Uncharacterized protein n=1 Tax=Acanthoscelides obtectus TaxID=200917 RepID=A0A9P0PGB8_ACAOB|nr:unnamed protein product [Acanthoscelides obtectus]CAK1642293.1 hypothetical protein AOBTE_LOCUS12958 [Acanthoscelides obtectus]
MCLTTKDQEKLRVLERKVIRRIMGPVKDNNEVLRPLRNEEIMTILNQEDIVRFIKSQRLR